jgi:hypothetical protein
MNSPPPQATSLVMLFLPFLVLLIPLGLGLLVWLLVRPRTLRIGERVTVWAGAEWVPATVVGGTRASIWVRYETGAEGAVPRAAVRPVG